jgi:hypothetical protein
VKVRASISDVMEGLATLTAPEIVVQSRDEAPVLAIDHCGAFGGAFRFGVFTGGEWHADVLYARRSEAGWDDLGSGGSYGDGWTTPWRPPSDGWDGDDLYVMGSGGMDVEDEYEVPHELRVVYGFASPAVVAIEVTGPTAARFIEISNPVGAFAVVLVGDGEFAITGRSRGGELRSSRVFSLRAFRS